MTLEDLKNIRNQAPRKIPGGHTLAKVIFPIKLVGRERKVTTAKGPDSPEGAYSLGVLPAGENGIRLMVLQNEKTIPETVSVNIEVREYQK